MVAKIYIYIRRNTQITIN